MDTGIRVLDRLWAENLIPQSVCGGSSSNLSFAVSIAMRLSASVRERFGLKASSSQAASASFFNVAKCAAVINSSTDIGGHATAALCRGLVKQNKDRRQPDTKVYQIANVC